MGFTGNPQNPRRDRLLHGTRHDRRVHISHAAHPSMMEKRRRPVATPPLASRHATGRATASSTGYRRSASAPGRGGRDASNVVIDGAIRALGGLCCAAACAPLGQVMPPAIQSHSTKA